MLPADGKASYLSVVLPAFNEEREIGLCLSRLVAVLSQKLGDDFSIIVVSDGSDDGTVDAARRAQVPNTTIVSLPERQGKGFALRHGFALSKSPFTAQLDADLDIAPGVLLNLLDILQESGSDIAVASKLHKDSVVHYPKSRRVLSAGYRFCVRSVLHLAVSDTQTGAKVYRTEVLHDLLPRLKESGFAIDLEILALASEHGYSTIEGPVDLDFQFRSSVRPGDVFRVFMATFRVWRELRSTSTFVSDREKRRDKG